jgi:uncharacterized protein YecA (UPF0149 family)
MQEVQYPSGRIAREYFTGEKVATIKARMDERLVEQQAEGATLIKRTKIGRNATCPCGSGRKFKKCCLSGAERVGVRR